MNELKKLLITLDEAVDINSKRGEDSELAKELAKEAGFPSAKWAYVPQKYNVGVFKLSDNPESKKSWAYVVFEFGEKGGEEEEDIFKESVNILQPISSLDEELGFVIIKKKVGTFKDVLKDLYEMVKNETTAKSISASNLMKKKK